MASSLITSSFHGPGKCSFQGGSQGRGEKKAIIGHLSFDIFHLAIYRGSGVDWDSQ